jgi:hypothetical protein
MALLGEQIANAALPKAAHGTIDTHPGRRGAPGTGHPPPATAPPTPPVAAPVDPNGSAKAILLQILGLGNMGLESLADWAWNTYTAAGGGDLGQKLVIAELPQQPAFKARFPAISDRVAKGLPAITPADYLNYETTIRQAFSAHGLPLPSTGPQFNDMVHTLLTNDVSAQEVVNQRIGSAFDRVFNAPTEVRQAAEQLFGIHGDSALAAFFLSPEHTAPQLEQLSQQAEIGGTATRFGIDLAPDRLARLQTLGADQQLGQFQKLSQEAPLFDANPGEDPSLTLANQGVASAFGENATAAQQVQRRLAERKAALGGGGQPYTSSSLSNTPGQQGLGSGPV